MRPMKPRTLIWGEIEYTSISISEWYIFAGPFSNAPMDGMKNINLQAEQPEGDAPIHYRLPIKDFSIPEIRPTVFALAWIIFQMVALERFVYIGCMGGVGRTGMILALLIKLITDVTAMNAIVHLRARYIEHAVETDEQIKFVSEFPMTTLRLWFGICKLIEPLIAH